VQLAQTFFPSTICAVVLPIIHLLEDGEVGDNGVAGGYILYNHPKVGYSEVTLLRPLNIKTTPLSKTTFFQYQMAFQYFISSQYDKKNMYD